MTDMTHTYRCPTCDGTMRCTSVDADGRTYTCDRATCGRVEQYGHTRHLGRLVDDPTVKVPRTGRPEIDDELAS